MFNQRTLLAIRLAKAAGKKILKIQKADMGTHAKGTNDVVTIADLASEKLITQTIAKKFPNDGFIAEEGSNKPTQTDYSWVIDPLDGTMNFSRKMHYFAVSIGYCYQGQPYGGAIYIPHTQELFVCEKGQGAFLNGQKIAVSHHSLDQSLAIIGFNNRQADFREYHSVLHHQLLHRVMNVEKIFPTVIGLCYVACGKVEIHCELNCFLWDVVPACLLIEEAGGQITQINGQPLDFNQIEKQCVVATNKKIHDEILQITKQ